MSDLRTALCALALIAGCDAAASKPASEHAERRTVVHGTEPLTWNVSGHAFTVRVATDDDCTSRLAFVDGATRHAIAIEPVEDATLRLIDGGLLLRTSQVVGRAPEVGALLAYQAIFVEWNANAKKPRVAKTWTCDDSTAADICTPPAWAERE